MKIQWMAHSCFKVTLTDGKVIIFDPYDESVGYKSEEMDADLVLISHDHKDHACLEKITGEYKLVKEVGKTEFDGISIEGIETPCTNKSVNRMYKVTAEGITMLHMGDVEDIPSQEIFDSLGNIDVLFIPVGGRQTIDGKQAIEICKQIDANIMIPMHYKTIFLELDLDSVFPFTDGAKKIFDRGHIVGSVFEISAANLKKRSRIIVMDAAMDD